jgi:hypothetical protein
LANGIQNVRLFFLGSDDFPAETKSAAAGDLNAALEAGWSGFPIGERVPLSDLLRLERVTNWELNASRPEIGLLIPSEVNTWRTCVPEFHRTHSTGMTQIRSRFDVPESHGPPVFSLIVSNESDHFIGRII